MTLKELYIKMKIGDMTEDALIEGLKSLTNNEKILALKCYPILCRGGMIVQFFSEFAKKHPKLFEELRQNDDAAYATRAQGIAVRDKMYEELIKDVT